MSLCSFFVPAFLIFLVATYSKTRMEAIQPICNGYQEPVLHCRNVNLVTNLNLELRLRMRIAAPHIRLMVWRLSALYSSC
jgi:hypothetical protein